MERDKHKTKVIFRQWRQDGAVFALFPELPGTMNPGTCASYEHMGQHGGASYIHCIGMSRPIGQYTTKVKELARELRGLGYHLEIVERCTREMDDARISALYDHPKQERVKQ